MKTLHSRIMFLGLILTLLNFSTLEAQQSIIDTIAFQDFEVSPQAPVWSYMGTPNLMSGYSTSSANPASSPLGINGSRAWETSAVSAGVILEFNNIVIPAIYDSIWIGFRLAAMNLTGSSGGPDNLDYVEVSYSLDNGATYINRLTIKGATTNNSVWPYSATGVALVHYTPTSTSVFNPTTSGLQTTMGYSTCGISFPGSISQLKLKIKARSSSSSDNWLIDNVLLKGKKSCSNSTSSIFMNACNSQISQSGNQIWTTSGTYMDTIPNYSGCDSIMTVQLTIHPTTYSSFDHSACFSYISPSGLYQWTSSGIYTDTIINSKGCDSVITINLTIDTVNTAVSYSNGTLSALAQGAVYQWLDCLSSFSPISGATSQNYIPSANGSYAVMLTQGGCTDTSDCLAVNDVSVKDVLNSSGITVYPNPAKENVSVSFDENMDEVNINLYNLSGSVIQSFQFSNITNFKLNLPREKGVYLLEINNGKTIRILKIVKI